MAEYQTFHWADYLVFASTLVVSSAIGVYFGCIGSRQQTTEEFLLGGKKLASLPVALSLQASFLSAIAILGWPAEAYFNGYMAFLIIIGQTIGLVVTAHVFVPVFCRMSFASAFEYIGNRFNKVVRVMGSLTFSLMMILYMAVVLYAPALAFSQVTGLSMWISILGIGLICTFYTTLGGIKAVVWTDAFQMVVLVIGVLTLLIKGCIDAGGLSTVWARAKTGSRLGPVNFDPHPHAPHTIWTESLGATFLVVSLFGCNQASIQRFMSMRSTRDAQKAVYFLLVNSLLMFIIFGFLGLVIYAYYFKCDPLTDGRVQKGDQIVLLFMMDVLGNLHGLPGLFTSAVFSGALSTVSSGVNSMAAVMLEDLAKPAHMKIKQHKMDERFATILSKLLAMSFGLATIGLAYIFSIAGQEILGVALSIFGMVGGPMLGLFSLALFFPFVNSWGAGSGLISGLVVCFWAGIGAIIYPSRYSPTLPLTTHGCAVAVSNYTTLLAPVSPVATTYTTPVFVESSSSDGLLGFYRISFMWYTLMGTMVTVLVGITVSSFTGCNKRSVDPELLFMCTASCCKTACCNVTSFKVPSILDRAGDSVASCAGKQYSYSMEDLPSAPSYLSTVKQEDPYYLTNERRDPYTYSNDSYAH